MMLKYSFISRKMKEFTFVFAILVSRKRYLLGDARRKTITKLLLMFRERVTNRDYPYCLSKQRMFQRRNSLDF